MWYALIIWTAVVSGNSYSHSTSRIIHDWRPLLETKSLQACEKAAADLGYVGDKKTNYRCISKD